MPNPVSSANNINSLMNNYSSGGVEYPWWLKILLISILFVGLYFARKVYLRMQNEKKKRAESARRYLNKHKKWK